MKKIKVVIDRIEEDMAILKINDVTINFPISQLPEDVKEGDVLNLIISKDGEQTDNSKNQAKNILNEILDSSQKNED